MLLELSDKDAQLLREVLASYLKELRGEIVDTDNREYKRLLKAERERLESIVTRLEHAPKAEEPAVACVVRVDTIWEMSGLD